MQEQMAVAPVDARAVYRGLDAVDQLAMRGQGLAEQQPAAGLVERRHVGEGAADIDGNAQPGPLRNRLLVIHEFLRSQTAALSVPIRLRSTPRPVISTSTTSPCFMYREIGRASCRERV